MRFIRQGYGEFTLRRTLGPALWPHHDLLFVHAGRIQLEFPTLGRSINLEQQTGVLIWPQTNFRGHSLVQRSRASIQHFLVESDTLVPFDGLVGQKHGISLQAVGHSAWVDACVRRLLDAGEPDAQRESKFLHRMRLALVLAEGGFVGRVRQEVTPRLAVEPLRDWARANLWRNLSIADLASRAELSPSRFREVFLAEQGVTVGGFLRALRMSEARRLLGESAMPIKEIAEAIGFADVVVFHRAFKVDTGQTPREYRGRNRILG